MRQWERIGISSILLLCFVVQMIAFHNIDNAQNLLRVNKALGEDRFHETNVFGTPSTYEALYTQAVSLWWFSLCGIAGTAQYLLWRQE